MFRISFSLRVRTYDEEGIIAATGDEDDYFYIVVRNGNLEANIRFEGKGPFPIHGKDVRVSDGQWHHVRIIISFLIIFRNTEYSIPRVTNPFSHKITKKLEHSTVFDF